MSDKSVEELKKSIRKLDSVDILAIAEWLFEQAKKEMAGGKQYSQEEIASLNKSRGIIARARKRLRPGD